jgi:hypothetical protein
MRLLRITNNGTWTEQIRSLGVISIVVNVCSRVNYTDNDRSSEPGVTGPEDRGRVMSCKLCSSTNEAEFAAEIMIHFSGRRHLENPGVLTFPRISVCLDCGLTRFTIPETELSLVREGHAPCTAAERKAARGGKAS